MLEAAPALGFLSPVKTPQFSAQMKTFDFFFQPGYVTLPLACLEVTLLSEASSFSLLWASPAHHRHHPLLFAGSQLQPAKTEEIKKAYKQFLPLPHNISDALRGTCYFLKRAQTSCTAREKQGINKGIMSCPTSETQLHKKPCTQRHMITGKEMPAALMNGGERGWKNK